MKMKGSIQKTRLSTTYKIPGVVTTNMSTKLKKQQKFFQKTNRKMKDAEYRMEYKKKD